MDSTELKAVASRAPGAVTADRGYGDAKVDAELTALGVKFVAIVRKGRQSVARRAAERKPRIRKLIKWRTGSEGRISALKRGYGWSRSLMDGLDGTRVWCGYGVFAHNSQKISSLLAHKDQQPPADAALPVSQGGPWRGRRPWAKMVPGRALPERQYHPRGPFVVGAEGACPPGRFHQALYNGDAGFPVSPSLPWRAGRPRAKIVLACPPTPSFPWPLRPSCQPGAGAPPEGSRIVASSTPDRISVP